MSKTKTVKVLGRFAPLDPAGERAVAARLTKGREAWQTMAPRAPY